MMIRDRSRPQRLRLFRNPWLEKLTVISPLGFVAIWSVMLSLAAFLSWGKASVPMSAGLFALGLLLWTLLEYVMHRFIFHLKLQSEWIQQTIFVVHGNHHVDPDDPYRNMMPPIISIPVASAIWGVFVLLAGPAGSILFLGFAMGYVAYDAVHYACHQFPMRGPVLGRLRKHHIRHHYAKREGNFAITALFWDRVFGTYISAKSR